MNYIRYALFSLSFIIILTACQSSSQITTNNVQPDRETAPVEEKSPFIPAWADKEEAFTFDNTAFTSTAMASNTDSVRASEMAHLAAATLLESSISKLLEKERAKLTKHADFNASATENNFIFKLRSVYSSIIAKANTSKLEVKKENNHYVAFAEVKLSKSDLNMILNQTLGPQGEYQKLVSAFFDE